MLQDKVTYLLRTSEVVDSQKQGSLRGAVPQTLDPIHQGIQLFTNTFSTVKRSRRCIVTRCSFSFAMGVSSPRKASSRCGLWCLLLAFGNETSQGAGDVFSGAGRCGQCGEIGGFRQKLAYTGSNRILRKQRNSSKRKKFLKILIGIFQPIPRFPKIKISFLRYGHGILFLTFPHLPFSFSAFGLVCCWLCQAMLRATITTTP